MSNEMKTYFNAGAQTVQALSEIRRFSELPDDAFVTLKTVSLVLDINRNKVNQVPVQHRLIDKRKVYRKGDISAWALLDVQQPDSILARLRDEQAKAVLKLEKHPSRRYQGGRLGKDEAEHARAASHENVERPFSVDEIGRRKHLHSSRKYRRATLPLLCEIPT